MDVSPLFVTGAQFIADGGCSIRANSIKEMAEASFRVGAVPSHSTTTKEVVWPKHRDAVGGLIIEGTTDMHHSTVAHLLGLPDAAIGIF